MKLIYRITLRLALVLLPLMAAWAALSRRTIHRYVTTTASSISP